MSARRQPVFDPGDVARFYTSVREAALQDRLRNLCRLLQLHHYHTHNSRRSEGGFPDSVVVRSPDEWERPWLVAVELKSETGKATPAQAVWGAALRAAEAASGGALCYRLIKPSTWDELTDLLASGRKGD